MVLTAVLGGLFILSSLSVGTFGGNQMQWNALNHKKLPNQVCVRWLVLTNHAC